MPRARDPYDVVLLVQPRNDSCHQVAAELSRWRHRAQSPLPYFIFNLIRKLTWVEAKTPAGRRSPEPADFWRRSAQLLYKATIIIRIDKRYLRDAADTLTGIIYGIAKF